MFDGAENGKTYGKGMNMVMQISRRFGRMTGVRTCSASADCVVRTVLFVPAPLNAAGKLFWADSITKGICGIYDFEREKRAAETPA